MTPTEQECHTRPRATHRRLLLLAAFVLALPAGGVAWWYERRETIPGPPAVPLDGLNPEVARSIEQTRAQVLESPRSGAAWGRLGMVLGVYHFFPQSISCEATAERLDPGEPRWPYYRGLAIELDGSPAQAVSAFRRAVELCPREPDAPRLHLAELLLKLGRLEEAETQFRELLAQDPGHARAHVGLARIALARGDPRGGHAELRRCLDSPSTRREAHVLLAEVQQRLGDQGASRATLREAASYPPDTTWPDPFRELLDDVQADRQALLNRARAVDARGRTREALELLQQVEGDYPGTRALVEGGRRLGEKDFPGAEQGFREAVRLAPDDDRAHYWLGVALLEQHDTRGAAACFREVLRLQPCDAGAYEKLAACLEAQGDRDAAVAALRESARYKPDDGAVQRRLGALLAEQGRQAEALTHLERALSLDPEDAQARELADRLRSRSVPKGR